ncbi:hypothetical protein ACJX0J_007364 [Zea mays]
MKAVDLQILMGGEDEEGSDDPRFSERRVFVSESLNMELLRTIQNCYSISDLLSLCSIFWPSHVLPPLNEISKYGDNSFDEEFIVLVVKLNLLYHTMQQQPVLYSLSLKVAACCGSQQQLTST